MIAGIVTLAGITLVLSTVVLATGFGLATTLTPLFALYFPVKTAITMVAVVHFANNLLKLGLFARHISLPVVKRFGALSFAGAFIGALLQFALVSHWVRVILGIVLILLGMQEFMKTKTWKIPQKWDWLGGLASGFVGGLVGNQGAIRSAYLLTYDMPKETFVATAALISAIVDVTRIPIYIATQADTLTRLWPELSMTVLAAFIGTILGKKLLKRLPLTIFRKLVAGVIIVFGVLLAGGVV